MKPFIFHSAIAQHLSNLSTNGTRHSQAGVHINKEALRVLLNLRDVEVGASVKIVVVENAGLEWSPLAPNRDAQVVISLNWLWILEGDAWRAGHADTRLVHVSRSVGGRLVVAAEVLELDLVADVVVLGVDAEVVVALCALDGVLVVG